jgi:hypothetical protein
MLAVRWPSKDAAEIDDRAIDFADRLSDGESITAVAWTVPTGLDLVAESNTASVANLRVAGGVAGARYAVTCAVTTSLNKVLRQSVVLRIRSR